MGLGIGYCARKLMFDPRASDATDFVPGSGD